MAKALIKRFGSLSRVVTAPVEQLNEVCGEHQTGRFIHAARMMVEAAFREEVIGSPVSSTDPALGRYLRSQFSHFRDERMHAIFLDGQQRYIADENVGEGTHEEVALQCRRLLMRAFELGAVSLILAHNHPSGDPLPSPADIRATQQLHELCAAVDITLADHLILNRNSLISMRTGGYF